ncbi:hypothetical protein NQ317_011147 [Molorchus minor]|uniref:DDE-1 domain-containing protein n=1 Tax=Molorchus minor TaxID=1323400 RepID=A0ABQ9JEQ1_9CUCU|nr:hypothetical protein NQ317_011147 [Molorchus minor]
MGVNEASKAFGIPSRTLRRRLASGNTRNDVRQSEGLSLARSKGMCREEVNSFYDLYKTLLENDLMDKPDRIYNMDESGIQLNNKPGKVIATKGCKDVHVLTSVEKGKCLNNCVWLKTHFVPRKAPGKALLILDGHASHLNSLEMLTYADDNDIIMICLPSHTTQALQPLDRSFFKPLKDYFKQEAEIWMSSNENRKIGRLHLGHLIGKAWEKAATVKNGVSGFRATGIFPFNRNAVPDHFYQISDNSINAESNVSVPDTQIQQDSISSRTVKISPIQCPEDPIISETSGQNATEQIPKAQKSATSKKLDSIPKDTPRKNDNSLKEHVDNIPEVPNGDPTPTKYLHDFVPIPTIPLTKSKRKQSAAILTGRNIEAEPLTKKIKIQRLRSRKRQTLQYVIILLKELLPRMKPIALSA